MVCAVASVLPISMPARRASLFACTTRLSATRTAGARERDPEQVPFQAEQGEVRRQPEHFLHARSATPDSG